MAAEEAMLAVAEAEEPLSHAVHAMVAVMTEPLAVPAVQVWTSVV